MSRWLRQLAVPLLVVASVHFAVTLTRRAYAEREPDRVQDGAALMPAAGGALEQLVIQFHRPGQDRFLEVFGALFGALEPSTEVIVVVGDDTDRAIFEAARMAWRRARGTGPSVSYAVVGRPITSWARDRFAVMPRAAAGPPTILAPPTPMTGPEARANDWLVPWTVSEHVGADLVRANFRFEGGDLIADESHAYIATPLSRRNPEISSERLRHSVQEVLQRPVIQIGSESRPSPDHHIGMFVTPLGGGLVLHGDPALGLQLVGGVVGHEVELDVGDAPLNIDTSQDTLRAFGDVAETLRSHRRQTLALPLLVSDEPHNWISYNNVLMERRRDGRLHVYMPTYGLPAMDLRAQEIYESVGAVVHPIAVERLFRLGGTVRCLVAPVSRAHS